MGGLVPLYCYKILDRIQFLLSTGCQAPSLSWFLENCLSLFLSLVQASDFLNAYEDLIRVYLKIKPLSPIQVVDTTFVKNVFGRNCVGWNPFDRGRKATKVSAVVDHKGIPLSYSFHRANKNDSRTLFYTP
jgi:hypothetical protein